MKTINVNLENYNAIAQKTAILRDFTTQIESQFNLLKDNESIQSIIMPIPKVTAQLEQSREAFSQITKRANNVAVGMAQAFNVYCLLNDYVKESFKDQTELICNEAKNIANDPYDAVKDGKAIYDVVGYVTDGTKIANNFFDVLKMEKSKIVFKQLPDGHWTVYGNLDGCKVGRFYNKQTLLDKTDELGDLFKTSERVNNPPKVPGAKIAGTWVLTAVSVGFTIYDGYNRISDISSDDSLSKKEKGIAISAVAVNSGVAIACDVVAAALTCTGIGAPVALALSVASMILTSDGGMAMTTAVIGQAVESVEQIGSSAKNAWETGKVDGGQILEDLGSNVGNAVKSGGEIITNAWDNLKNSESVLDGVSNTIELACSAVAGVATTAANTAIAVGTALVNGAVSTTAAVAKKATETAVVVGKAVATTTKAVVKETAKVVSSVAKTTAKAVTSVAKSASKAVKSVVKALKKW